MEVCATACDLETIYSESSRMDMGKLSMVMLFSALFYRSTCSGRKAFFNGILLYLRWKQRNSNPYANRLVPSQTVPMDDQLTNSIANLTLSRGVLKLRHTS